MSRNRKNKNSPVLRLSKHKRWFAVIVVILLSLAFLGPAQAIWQEDQVLTASDSADDKFGYSVSISGDYAIVGAPLDDYEAGSAYIFRREGAGWSEQVKLTDPDPFYFYEYGYSVSISGDYAIVGCPFHDLGRYDDVGSVYVYKRNDDNWSLQETLTPTAVGDFKWFGYSVSVHGDSAIIGSVCNRAYIFAPNSVDPNSWYQQAEIVAPNVCVWLPELGFGQSVSICGDLAVVGHGADNSAYIYRRQDDSWSLETTLSTSDANASEFDDFGCSVSISGDFAIVGFEVNNSAYIFAPNSVDPNSWDQQAKLTASDNARAFGWRVSISGDYAIVKSNDGPYIFERTGENWSEQAKLVASGSSVSISGDSAIVGAPYTNSASVFKKTCPAADLSGDCYVDFADYSILADGWKSTPLDSSWNPSYNLAEPNDIIDEYDLEVLVDNWLMGY